MKRDRIILNFLLVLLLCFVTKSYAEDVQSKERKEREPVDITAEIGAKEYKIGDTLSINMKLKNTSKDSIFFKGFFAVKLTDGTSGRDISSLVKDLVLGEAPFSVTQVAKSKEAINRTVQMQLIKPLDAGSYSISVAFTSWVNSAHSVSSDPVIITINGTSKRIW